MKNVIGLHANLEKFSMWRPRWNHKMVLSVGYVNHQFKFHRPVGKISSHKNKEVQCDLKMSCNAETTELVCTM